MSEELEKMGNELFVNTVPGMCWGVNSTVVETYRKQIESRIYL